MKIKDIKLREVLIFGSGIALATLVGGAKYMFSGHQVEKDKKAVETAINEIMNDDVVRVPITALDREGLKESNPETLAKIADAFNKALAGKLAEDSIYVTRTAMTRDSIFQVPFSFVLPNNEEGKVIDKSVLLQAAPAANDTVAVVLPEAGQINKVKAKTPKPAAQNKK